MTSSCRVSIYSQDSLGLGHLRRNILIGGALLKARKDSNLLLFADSPVAPFFKLPDRMDHIKLPSIRKVSAGCWEGTRLRIDERELIRLRAELLCDGLLNFRPDLLLVDHMPGGAQGELAPAIKALKQAHPKCWVVLGLRDILDATQKAERFIAGVEFEAFQANDEKVFAVIRALEIIGEATKKKRWIYIIYIINDN